MVRWLARLALLTGLIAALAGGGQQAAGAPPPIRYAGVTLAGAEFGEHSLPGV
ncbi:MAG TPA: hypothetical protein VGE07_17450 [Herpetosiphonaceae bacterium]